MIEIHSCSYFCERPDCVKTQRDEMRDNGAYEQGEEMYKAIRRECDAKLAKFEAENAALRGLLERAKWMELYGEIVAEKNK